MSKSPVLSMHEYILYTTWYSSLTLVWEGRVACGRWWERRRANDLLLYRGYGIYTCRVTWPSHLYNHWWWLKAHTSTYNHTSDQHMSDLALGLFSTGIGLLMSVTWNSGWHRETSYQTSVQQLRVHMPIGRALKPANNILRPLGRPIS